jgi:hypothetical protein
LAAVRTVARLLALVVAPCLVPALARGEEPAPPSSSAPASPSPPSSASTSIAPTGGERLRAILDVASSQERHGRATHAILDAVGVATYGSAGVALVTRDDSAVRAVGVALLLHGAVDLVDLSFTLFPSPIEYLHAEFEQRRASGLPLARAQVETERDWQAAIGSAHRMAVWNAAVDFVLGSAETAVGLYWLIAPPGMGMSREEQTTWGTVLLGLGLPGLGYGFGEVLTIPPVEQWWRLYRAVTPDASAAPNVSLHASPVPGGAMGVVRILW